MVVSNQLAKLQTSLQKQYGERSAVFASDLRQPDIISSGSLALDFATGIGGFPHNRVIEFAGKEGSGKTTLSFLTIKSFLEKFETRAAVICDMEHRITRDWVKTLLGYDLMSRLLIVQPDNAEQATDMYLDCLKTDQICIFSYDSIGGSPSQRVMDKSATVGNVGGNALAMTRFAQFASIYSDKYNCLTVCINQIRDDMGGYNRLITPGGHGLKHAYSLRIELKPGKEKIMDKVDGEEVQVGYNVVAKIIKNSLAAPFKATHYLFYYTQCKYGFGIDTLEETIRLGILTGVIYQGGRWYSHPALPDGKVGSRDILVNTIRSDQNVRDSIVKEIVERLSKENIKGIASSFDPDSIDDDPEQRLISVTNTLSEDIRDTPPSSILLR